MVWKNRKNGLISGSLHGSVHLLFFNYKGDDSGSGKLVSFFYRKISMAGRNHHLSQRIHSQKCISADFQNSVLISDQLNFSFPDIGSMHGFSGTNIIKKLSRLVFMENSLFFLPHEKMFFSN